MDPVLNYQVLNDYFSGKISVNEIKEIIKKKFEKSMEEIEDHQDKDYQYYKLKYVGDDDYKYEGMTKSKKVGASNLIYVYYHFLFNNNYEDLMSNCIDYWLKNENSNWELESDYTINDLSDKYDNREVNLMKVFKKFFNSDTFRLEIYNKPNPIILDFIY